jgi:hypothetical protein
MKKAFVLGATVLAAALVASSIDAAATSAKPAKRWRGTAVYTYTYKGDDRTVQQTVSGSVVMVPTRARGWTGAYEVSSGTIKSNYAEKSSDGCTLTSSGTYRAPKSLLVLQVSGGSASLSGSEGAVSAPVPATRTCTDGSSLESPVPVFNPFFMLTRHTAGFAVKGSPGKFAGTLRRAESGAVWTVRFSFAGQR